MTNMGFAFDTGRDTDATDAIMQRHASTGPGERWLEMAAP